MEKKNMPTEKTMDRMELILKNFNLALSVRPMDPPQYRTIGIASPPLDRLSIVTKTFIHYLSEIAPKEYREMC